jgi:hypothetical protein
MNKSDTAVAVGLIVLAVLGGLFGAWLYVANRPQTGGDFAGGIQPSNLWNGTASTNSVSPVLSNVYVPGNLSVGGVGANNQLTEIYTAVGNFPSAAGTLSGSTSTASTTQIAFTASGFAVGDPCEVEYNFTTSTLLTSANVTAVSGNAVTTTVSFANGSGVSIADAVTSTITGVSSTVKATCFHTGV